MEWIVKFEAEKKHRIRIKFMPVLEKIYFYGEVNMKGKWRVFSMAENPMDVAVEDLLSKLDEVSSKLDKSYKAFQNLNEGFSVIKEIGIQNVED